MYTENVIRELQGSAEALKEIESEWAQLEEDRRLLRKIFPRVLLQLITAMKASGFWKYFQIFE